MADLTLEVVAKRLADLERKVAELSGKPTAKDWRRTVGKRTTRVARKRARAPSFEELLQSLRRSFQGRLFPPLGGFVYRFTIFLPLLSEGREVFSISQRRLLAKLFHACFGGYTEASAEGHPPWYGSWALPSR